MTDTQGRHSHEDGSRDWRDVSARQGMPGAPAAPREAQRGSPSEPSQGISPADDTFSVDSGLLNYERVHFCWFEPANLWSFVIVTLVN